MTVLVVLKLDNKRYFYPGGYFHWKLVLGIRIRISSENNEAANVCGTEQFVRIS